MSINPGAGAGNFGGPTDSMTASDHNASAPAQLLSDLKFKGGPPPCPPPAKP